MVSVRSRFEAASKCVRSFFVFLRNDNEATMKKLRMLYNLGLTYVRKIRVSDFLIERQNQLCCNLPFA